MFNYIVRGKEFEVMIKRIIFDVDDTLIDWKDEYDKVINNVVENLNIYYKKRNTDAELYFLVC